MKVVLRDDVDGVGRRGDIVEVSGGFARNFLLPASKAIVATPGVEAQAAAMRRARDLRATTDRASADTVAETLRSARITIEARAGAEGRLFGSVTAADVADALKAKTGADVDRRRIILGEPIRSVGTHSVTVRLHSDVELSLDVEVVAAA